MPDPTDPADGRRGRPPRYHHRSRSHDSAHADESLAADGQPAYRIANHPLVPKGAPEYVMEADGLTKLIRRLRAAGSFAYDSEFIGELTYVPKLCLIQVATAEFVALIDPLDDIDLTPFWELICDPTVEKIVHAGQQDVEPVFRHLNRPPANLFDCQIAAGFLGLSYPLSLSKLVLEMVGVKLGKGLTFTHWDQRPLSAMQLRYAADDVRYLPAARAELGRRLEAAGHAAWAAEESAALADPNLYQFDPANDYLKIRGAGGLMPANQAVLRELMAWRERSAQAEDCPPRSFLKDEILLDLARSPVKSVEKLDRVKGLPRPVEAAHGQTIVDLTLRALSQPTDRHAADRPQEPTPAEKFQHDAIWAAAQTIAAGRGIDPALVASRQEVGEFFRSASAGKDVERSRLYQGWRRAAFGEPLLKLIRGDGRVTLNWKDGSLRADTT